MENMWVINAWSCGKKRDGNEQRTNEAAFILDIIAYFRFQTETENYVLF